MSQHLETLMLQHNLFAVYKREPSSIAALEQIVDEFRPYFDPPIVDRDHLSALVEKIKHKITRIRTELLGRGALTKTGTGFVVTPEKPAISPACPLASNPQRRLQLKEWTQHHCPGLSPTDTDFAIHAFLLHIDHLRYRTESIQSCHSTSINIDT
jgi:hypothetical protein